MLFCQFLIPAIHTVDAEYSQVIFHDCFHSQVVHFFNCQWFLGCFCPASLLRILCPAGRSLVLQTLSCRLTYSCSPSCRLLSVLQADVCMSYSCSLSCSHIYVLQLQQKLLSCRLLSVLQALSCKLYPASSVLQALSCQVLYAISLA